MDCIVWWAVLFWLGDGMSVASGLLFPLVWAGIWSLCWHGFYFLASLCMLMYTVTSVR